jgi:hypothetical protein
MLKTLFVVGFPRSGTKLLLQILKTHPSISGPNVEVNLAHRLSSKTSDSEFKRYFEGTTMVRNIESTKKQQLDLFLKKNSIKKFSSLEHFYAQFLSIFKKNDNPKYIIDKSPRYITHIQHLLKEFPNSKIVHIIRNVKSTANSHSKVWNKNVYKVADQWNKSVCSVSKEFEDSSKILVIKYEDLVEFPKKQSEKLSNYLDLENRFDIINVDSKEKHGNIKSRGVFKNNKKLLLGNSNEKRIEEIAFPALKRYSYKINYAKNHRKLSKFRKLIFFMKDHINLMIFHVREKGLVRGISYYRRLLN